MTSIRSILPFTERLRDQSVPGGDPVVAIPDGVPVERHAASAGLLTADDQYVHAEM
jgi:hypothetical protein